MSESMIIGVDHGYAAMKTAISRSPPVWWRMSMSHIR